MPPSEGLGRKARVFACDALGYGTAPAAVWEAANDKTVRPVWLALGGSRHEVEPFVTNLKLGRVAEIEPTGYSRKSGTKVEVLKTAPYVWSTHTVATPSGEEVLTFGFASEPCTFTGGGVDPSGVRCLCLTPQWYAAESDLDPAQVAALTPLALMLGVITEASALPAKLPHIVRTIAMIDRRISLPLIPALRFSVMAYADLHEAKLIGEAGNRYRYHHNDWRYGLEQTGPIASHIQMTAVAASMPAIERALTATIQRYVHGTA